jgi:hypothetical protein
VRKLILQPVQKTKATSELVDRNGGDLSMVVMMEFNPEVMLEKVPIGASLEGWA